MNETDERRAYVAHIMQRLRAQYGARTPLPLRGTATVRPAVIDRPGVLSLPQLRRLFRCVISEGYGE